MLVDLGPPETPAEGKIELERLIDELLETVRPMLLLQLEGAYRCGVVQSAYAKASWKAKVDKINAAARGQTEGEVPFSHDVPAHVFVHWIELGGAERYACHEHTPAYVDIASDHVDVWEYGVPEWRGIVRCWHCGKLLAEPDKPGDDEEAALAEQDALKRRLDETRQQTLDKVLVALSTMGLGAAWPKVVTCLQTMKEKP